MINDNVTLLDKVTFYKLNILRIDDFKMQELTENGAIRQGQRLNYELADGKMFSSLKIVDIQENFTLKAGCSMKKAESGNLYCDLQVSINNDNNLNCYTVSDYFYRLLEIQQILNNKYGIDIDMSVISLKSAEINRTLALNYSFDEYNRVFKLILNNLPYPFEIWHKWGDKENNKADTETLISKTCKSNKSGNYKQFKIYDKGEQLANIMLEDNLMRVELTLVGAEQIKRAFGTNNFVDIDDDMLDSYFVEQMHKLIEQQYYKWIESRDKTVTQLLKKAYKSNKSWHKDVINALFDMEIKNDCPAVLGIDDIYKCLDKMKLERRQKYEAKKRLANAVELTSGLNENASSLLRNDNEKMLEILNKLTDKMSVKTSENVRRITDTKKSA